MNKDRDISIDLAKGIAMLLVIWGHYGWKGTFNTWIYAFHMPFFIFVSGYLRGGKVYKHGDYGSFLKKRVRRLIVPYIVYSLLNLCVFIGIKGIGVLESSLTAIFFWVTIDDFPIAGALWFLIALFWIEIIYTFFVEHGVVVVRLLLCILFPAIGLLIPFALPYAIKQAFVLYPFYYVGVEMRTTDVLERIRSKIGDLRTELVTALNFVGGGILAIANGKVNYRDITLNNNVIAYITAFFLCVSCMYICKMFSQRYQNYRITSILVTDLTYVGVNSLHYLGSHQLIGDTFYKILFNRVNSYICCLITFCGIVVICSIYICVLNRVVKATGYK